MKDIDTTMKEIALRLRKTRELKGLTRDQFYASELGENPEYWGLIERGEQNLSLPKLILICDYYHIPINDLVDLSDTDLVNSSKLQSEISDLMKNCDVRQLEVVKKFIEDIVVLL